MKHYILTYTLLLISIITISCNNKKGENNINDLKLKYAKGLIITHHEKYNEVKILDPWNEGKILHTYILVDRDKDVPKDLPEGTIIKTPLSKALVYSSVHTGIIKEITGSYNSIGGVCDAQYFTDKGIKALISSRSIKDCGSTMSPSMEQILELQPDAIILSPFQNAGYGLLTQSGIPIIECADYMENTPLGRAEWIKLFGLLFGESARCDSIFNNVANDYTALSSLSASAKKRPKVITETITNGVWYVPGGNSYMANLITDAGGNYPWKNDTNSGSIQLDFAQVFDKAHDADIWLIKSFKDETHASIKSIYELNAKMKAFNINGIYACNTQVTSLFDDFPFHPERILREYIAIFHPDLLPDYKLCYFKQVIK